MSFDRISRAAGAAEQLSAALWETLREQIDAGEPGRASELTRRLVEVCESFGAVADLAASVERQAPAATTGAVAWEAVSREPSSNESPSGKPAVGGEPSAPARLVEAAADGVGVDDSTVSQAPRDDSTVSQARRDDWSASQAPREDSTVSQRPRPFSGVAASLVDEYDEAPGPIEVKDVRAGGHPPVAAAVQRRLDRHAVDGAPFALLLVEVLDVERLRALRAGGELLHEIWAIESAVAEQLRPADSLLREIDGRWWLLAPETDAAGARELAERLSAAARRFVHRGAPMRVVIGIAICPDHGDAPSTLIGHADVDLYAAQAAGRSIGGGYDDEPQPA